MTMTSFIIIVLYQFHIKLLHFKQQLLIKIIIDSKCSTAIDQYI